MTRSRSRTTRPGPGGELAVVPEGGDPADAIETPDASGDRGDDKPRYGRLGPRGLRRRAVRRATARSRPRFATIYAIRRRDSSSRPTGGTYAPGQAIEVSWTRAPANRWDWLAIFEAAAPDPERDDYLIWTYTAGHSAGTLPPTIDGGATLGPDSQGEPWPLPAGDYVIHYLLADEYESAGTAPFRVRGAE